jgi:hypothetical protein
MVEVSESHNQDGTCRTFADMYLMTSEEKSDFSYYFF